MLPVGRLTSWKVFFTFQGSIPQMGFFWKYGQLFKTRTGARTGMTKCEKINWTKTWASESRKSVISFWRAAISRSRPSVRKYRAAALRKRNSHTKSSLGISNGPSPVLLNSRLISRNLAVKVFPGPVRDFFGAGPKAEPSIFGGCAVDSQKLTIHQFTSAHFLKNNQKTEVAKKKKQPRLCFLGKWVKRFKKTDG